MYLEQTYVLEIPNAFLMAGDNSCITFKALFLSVLYSEAKMLLARFLLPYIGLFTNWVNPWAISEGLHAPSLKSATILPRD
jgi:hypothetical protein